MEIIVTQTDPLVEIQVNDYPIAGQDQTYSLEENPTFSIDDDANYLVMKDEEGSTIFGLSEADVSRVSVNGSGGFTTIEQVRDAISAQLPIDGIGTPDYEVVTVAQFQALTPVIGTTYKITNPMGLNTPIYITYKPDNNITEGQIEIANTTVGTRYYKITYDPVEDKITSLTDSDWANKFEQGGGTGFNTPNAVEFFIDHLSSRTNVPTFNNCKIGSAEITMFSDGNDPGQLFYGNEIRDDNTVTIGETAFATCLYLMCFWRNTLLIKDGADAQFLFLYNSTTVTIGEGTVVHNARFYDNVTISIPDGKNYSAVNKVYEARPGSNTFNESIDVLADTTPDLTTVAWAGELEFTATGASISLSELQNLTEGQSYKCTAAAGKTITFVNGATIKCLGGANFVCVGNNNDFVIFKVISGVPTAQYQAKH